MAEYTCESGKVDVEDPGLQRLFQDLNDVLKRYERLVIDQYDGWIQTYTGKKLNPANPSLDQICLEDIARGLSKICRYSGQSRIFYPVSTHSVHVSRDVARRTGDAGLARAAFLHDSPEAYLCDIAKPVKILCPVYNILEDRMSRAIETKFKLAYRLDHKEIKKSDKALLYTEKPQVHLKVKKAAWKNPNRIKPLDIKISEKSHEEAYEMFMNHAKELGLHG